MPAICVGGGASPGAGRRSREGGTTRGARSASLGSPDFFVSLRPTASKIPPFSCTSSMEQPATRNAAQHAAITGRIELAGRDLGGMLFPRGALLTRIVSAVALDPNPLRYNGFAASLRLSTRDSYRSPITPATMATAAMLKTYQ